MLNFFVKAWLIILVPLSANAQEAHRPDGVTICTTLEPTILDPTLGAGQVIREIVYGNIFEGLTAIARNGNVVPRLAKSWEVSRDGLHYIFRLQENATFHDGKPFTADDVKFTFQRAMAPDSKNIEKWIFEPIKSVEVRDPHTVEIVLNHASGLFLYGLGWGDAVIFSPQSSAQNATQPVGTGPYRFKTWRRGDRLVMERSDNWWGGTPPIKIAVFRFIGDERAMIIAVETGDCDLLPAAGAPEQIERLRKNPNLEVTVGETEGETILAINNAKPPFNDLRVRQALTHAINRKAVIDVAMSGHASPIGSHFSPTHPAYIDLTNYAPYDPLKAKDLLKQAGLEYGFDTSIAVPPMAYARRSAQVISSMLSKVGIKTQLIPLEFPQWLERVYKNKDYDLSIIAHTEPLDIKIYAREDYYFQYRSPGLQKLINHIFSAVDENKRNELFKQAQIILAKDAVNVFLFELPKITIVRKGLMGARMNWPIPVDPISELSWR